MESNSLTNDSTEALSSSEPAAASETPASGKTIVCPCCHAIHKRRKRKLNTVFAFTCAGTAGDNSEAHSVLEGDDLLRMKLDYASATQTPSTATGANILSTLKTSEV